MDSCIRTAKRYSRKWAYNNFDEWQSSRRHNFTKYDCRDLYINITSDACVTWLTRGYNFFYFSVGFRGG